ncbi:MAG: SRPBCC family protein [Solirubrobacteraceae bacterium]
MTTQGIDATATASIVVQAPLERAFDVFTAGMATWWPPEHHLIEAELAEMVVEPRVGGHIFDRGVDGSECHWARVLAYEPPHRFVFSWDISTQWKIETDLAKTSEVEVRFIAQAPDRTLVELEHRELQRHGDGWEGMRDSVGSPQGWQSGLELFAAKLAA